MAYTYHSYRTELVPACSYTIKFIIYAIIYNGYEQQQTILFDDEFRETLSLSNEYLGSDMDESESYLSHLNSMDQEIQCHPLEYENKNQKEKSENMQLSFTGSESEQNYLLNYSRMLYPAPSSEGMQGMSPKRISPSMEYEHKHQKENSENMPPPFTSSEFDQIYTDNDMQHPTKTKNSWHSEQNYLLNYSRILYPTPSSEGMKRMSLKRIGPSMELNDDI
eukprot:CAMPEP_0201596396 /NCGR_PEP_ID=MMETSP0190_2-20130828/193091_1 /ASSEMBLY_ACC=CAM_ASM_000263 /TAXON_ID=37353 /ORGANISM="Rosalina sp." /LENGTH=220 /DNA_ID=CAMNT_0048056721 /DNA_START=119 /DNA_END=778 /DNA_ORIENTATION=+